LNQVIDEGVVVIDDQNLDWAGSYCGHRLILV
jgi:hypothetical protein